MRTTTMKSPIRWVGGKSRLAQQIVELFPSHSCYVEVFAGGLWVFFRKSPSRYEVINDLDDNLVNLWKVIQNEKSLEKFLHKLDGHPVSRTLFYEYKKSDWNSLNRVDRAVRFYFLIRTSFSASDLGTGNESWSSGPKSKPAFATFYSTQWKAIWDRLKDVRIENRDFEKILKRYDSEDTLFYLDPPYWVTRAGKYYKRTMEPSDHERLARSLNRIKGKFVLSYDDAKRIRSMYKSHTVHTLENIYSASNSRKGPPSRPKKRELIITNF